MADQTNPNDGAVAPKRDQSQKTQPQSASSRIVKEQEPAGIDQEKKILSEIIETSEAVDYRVEKQVREEITEAKLARPEPELPPDVADSGVKSPQLEAEKVIRGGGSIELPITEEQYQKGLHRKVAGVVVNSVIFGVSGLAGLAAWVGRKIKIAHRNTIKVVFKKQGGT